MAEVKGETMVHSYFSWANTALDEKVIIDNAAAIHIFLNILSPKNTYFFTSFTTYSFFLLEYDSREKISKMQKKILLMQKNY